MTTPTDELSVVLARPRTPADTDAISEHTARYDRRRDSLRGLPTRW